MRAYKTGHVIADTVSYLISDLPDGDYAIGYGILRGTAEHLRSYKHWFNIDKGFWDSGHYNGNYRLSYKGTQPIYSGRAMLQEHTKIKIDPWRIDNGYTLIVPPTNHVCEFFGIDYTSWLINALRISINDDRRVRYKGDKTPIDWPNIGKVITFNSSIGWQALQRGITVISDKTHSIVGSFIDETNSIDSINRMELFSICAAHQFKLGEKDKICRIINHYLSTSGMIAEKP